MYQPEECKIFVNRYLITGLDNSFIETFKGGFLLRLTAASDSLELLKQIARRGGEVTVEVKVALDKEGVRIEDYDIHGAYFVEFVGYKLTTSFPVVTFKFSN